MEDGTAKVIEKVRFENNLTYNEKVKKCIELAQLAPTSSNLQLWEAYHITDPKVLKEIGHACLDQ